MPDDPGGTVDMGWVPYEERPPGWRCDPRAPDSKHRDTWPLCEACRETEGVSWGAAGETGLCFVHVEPGIRRELLSEGGPLDVRGCVVPAGVIKEIAAAKKVPSIWASHAVFEGPLDFSGGRSFRDVAADGARFKGAVNFAGARIRREAFFYEARFEGPACFSRARFPGSATFQDVSFEGSVLFNDAVFDKWAEFTTVGFRRSVNFHAARFRAGARFRDVGFGPHADFTGICVDGPLRFEDARFNGPVSFNAAEFNGPVAFTAEPWGELDPFNDPVMYDRPRPRLIISAGAIPTRFKGPASFAAATFAVPADFTCVVFDGAMPNFTGTTLNGIILNPSEALAGWKPLAPLTRLARHFGRRLDAERTTYLQHTPQPGVIDLAEALLASHNLAGARYVHRISSAGWPQQTYRLRL